MNRDIQSCVLKYIANNSGLSAAIIKQLKGQFGGKLLPEEMVKIVVRYALHLSRDTDIDPESSVFEEKLKSFINQTKPRFAKKINEGRRN
ncbi:MAG: hypothetical protein AB7P76_03790 [Candidatus Melainabacteria bacterium]